jgi:flagellar assembly protein FliH
MSTVIKAADHEHSVHGVALNLEDLAHRADGYLQKVREQATQIVAQAAREAVGLRQAAEIAGRQAAAEAAERSVEQKLAQQLETVLPALRGAITEIERSKHGWLAHWERQAVRLSAAMAARVCRRELTHQPEIAIELVREALELAGGGGARQRLLIHPEDHAALGPQLERVIGEFARLAPTELIADARISRGGCRVETEYGAIDQQFESQLARIEQELL